MVPCNFDSDSVLYMVHFLDLTVTATTHGKNITCSPSLPFRSLFSLTLLSLYMSSRVLGIESIKHIHHVVWFEGGARCWGTAWSWRSTTSMAAAVRSSSSKTPSRSSASAQLHKLGNQNRVPQNGAQVHFDSLLAVLLCVFFFFWICGVDAFDCVEEWR